MTAWAQAAPDDVVATAAGELAGTTTSATYGPPYNNAADGQKLGPLPLQKWGGVRLPVDSAGLVLDPLSSVSKNPELTARWRSGRRPRPTNAPNGQPTTPTPSARPRPTASRPRSRWRSEQGRRGRLRPGAGADQPAFLGLAHTGGLEGALTSSGNFYGGDATKSLLLLADGAYLEDQARAQHLGGDQWGMMNETGNYPGQPWMWLYTFWYQVPPFSTSDNADALVWGLMMLLTLLLMFVPFIPGLRSIPRWIPIHRLVWRNYYRSANHS